MYFPQKWSEIACGHCQGTSCTNGSSVDVAEGDSDEADDQD